MAMATAAAMAGPAVGEAAAAAARARRAADAAAVAKARSAAKEAARRDKREYRALALRSGGAGATSDGDASEFGSSSDGDADPTAERASIVARRGGDDLSRPLSADEGISRVRVSRLITV